MEKCTHIFVADVEDEEDPSNAKDDIDDDDPIRKRILSALTEILGINDNEDFLGDVPDLLPRNNPNNDGEESTLGLPATLNLDNIEKRDIINAGLKTYQGMKMCVVQIFFRMRYWKLT